jgi:hypothetical protein
MKSFNKFQTHDYITPATANAAMRGFLVKENKLKTMIDTLLNTIGTDYEKKIAEKCPEFPLNPRDWNPSTGRINGRGIGNQLMLTAMLQTLGVQPKVFQLIQGGYDTHHNQHTKLQSNLDQLTTGIDTYIKAAKACGFWDSSLISTTSDFGRRFIQNSNKGTDHGWGHWSFLFGKDLKQKIIGFNAEKNSNDIADILPDYNQISRKTRSDVPRVTKLRHYWSCLLQSLCLPWLKRLEEPCPTQMQFKDGLPLQSVAAEAETPVEVVSDVPLRSARGAQHKALNDTDKLHLARTLGFARDNLKEVEASLGESEELTASKVADYLEQNVENASPDNFDQIYKGYKKDVVNVNTTRDLKFRHSNLWNTIMRLPYPRKDGAAERVKRYGMEHLFDKDFKLIFDGKKDFRAKRTEINEIIKEKATGFFTGKHPRMNKPIYKGFLENFPDLKLLQKKTFEDVLSDWSTPECNFEELFIIDRENKTAYLSCDGHPCKDNHTNQTHWKRQARYEKKFAQKVKECTSAPRERIMMNGQRNKHLIGQIGYDLQSRVLKEFSTQRGFIDSLKNRMVSFWLWQWFSTPVTDVRMQWNLMYEQYNTVRKNALGDFKEFVVEMFEDQALRLSLNAPQKSASTRCNKKTLDAPIENLGRELLELFTVGVGRHSYKDIVAVSKALNTPCQAEYSKRENFLDEPGMIFTDVKQQFRTDTKENRRKLIEHIMHAGKTGKNSSSWAAQYLCKKLYREFVRVDLDYEHNSVQDCAAEIYSHDWKIVTGVKQIIEDPLFHAQLGNKSRWPMNIIFGAAHDFDLQLTLRDRRYFKQVGQELFLPPNVNGFEHGRVWSTLRLSYAHAFLSQRAGKEIRRELGRERGIEKRDDFKSLEAYKKKFADLKVDCDNETSEECFSVAAKLCGTDFIETNGKEGKEKISPQASWFANKRNPWRNAFNAHRGAAEFAMQNICEMIN